MIGAQKPFRGAVLNRAHPLARAMSAAWLLNECHGAVVTNYANPGAGNGTLTGGASWDVNTKGSCVKFTANTHVINCGPNNLLLPTSNCSIVLGYRKRDAVFRSATAFVAYTNNNDRCYAHLPIATVPPQLYWYFGPSAALIISSAGITFGSDIWVLTTGGRGMEIWQNGTLITSNSTNATRTSTAATFFLGQSGVSDMADYSFAYIYKRQLGIGEIQQLHLAPYSMFSPVHPAIYAAAASKIPVFMRHYMALRNR